MLQPQIILFLNKFKKVKMRNIVKSFFKKNLYSFSNGKQKIPIATSADLAGINY